MAGMLVGMAFVPWRSSLDLRGGMIIYYIDIYYVPRSVDILWGECSSTASTGETGLNSC